VCLNNKVNKPHKRRPRRDLGCSVVGWMNLTYLQVECETRSRRRCIKSGSLQGPAVCFCHDTADVQRKHSSVQTLLNLPRKLVGFASHNRSPQRFSVVCSGRNVDGIQREAE
jgi:hypothetical protein